MRKALIPAFLLVLGATVLGATVFRDQLANAMPPGLPPQNVVVANTSTNPVPVQQVGTSTSSVTGTVGIDSSQNTVNLDSTDGGRLANIESAVGKLKFDSGGNLETTSQPAAPGAVTEHCLESQQSTQTVVNDFSFHTLCSDDFYATDITASGMDDALDVAFLFNGNVVLELNGSDFAGGASYQLDLTHPLHIDEIEAECNNQTTNCDFSLAVLGNSTGS